MHSREKVFDSNFISALNVLIFVAFIHLGSRYKIHTHIRIVHFGYDCIEHLKITLSPPPLTEKIEKKIDCVNYMHKMFIFVIVNSFVLFIALLWCLFNSFRLQNLCNFEFYRSDRFEHEIKNIFIGPLKGMVGTKENVTLRAPFSF